MEPTNTTNAVATTDNKTAQETKVVRTGGVEVQFKYDLENDQYFIESPTLSKDPNETLSNHRIVLKTLDYDYVPTLGARPQYASMTPEQKKKALSTQLAYCIVQFPVVTYNDNLKDEEAKKADVAACDAANVASLQAAMSKFGVAQTVDLVNFAVASKQTLKARTKVPTTESKDPADDLAEKVKRATSDMVVFGISDAESWEPGQKELTWIGWTNKAKAAMNDGDLDLAQKCMARAQELMMRV